MLMMVIIKVESGIGRVKEIIRLILVSMAIVWALARWIDEWMSFDCLLEQTCIMNVKLNAWMYECQMSDGCGCIKQS